MLFMTFSYNNNNNNFYTHNVKILIFLYITDGLWNTSAKQNFVKLAQGACRYCIASEVMHIDFQCFIELLSYNVKKYILKFVVLFTTYNLHIFNNVRRRRVISN